MLVFLSDTHLTDGSTCETINPKAFNKFTMALEDMVETATVTKVEVVFLGDIFDIIRSEVWLTTSVRPWSPGNYRNGSGKGIKDYTLEIVKKICTNEKNIESMQYLREFKSRLQHQNINVTFTYIVGNHDWLINRYPEARVRIARFMGMENPDRYKRIKFKDEVIRKSYKVLARHGDIYDPFNYDGDRDASSIGDAIVIDLLNKFPRAVETAIGINTDPSLITELKEIDNVRPLVDIPLWIHGVCLRAHTTATCKKVKEVWNEVADEFLKIPFIHAHDKPWQFDAVDALQLGLKISGVLSLQDIGSLPLRKLQKNNDHYVKMAFQEDHLARNEVENVVYGHTHYYMLQPLDQVHINGRTIGQKYFNCGTWRKVHKRTAFDQKSYEFSGWHMMTFIAFYRDSEHRDRSFEVWNGALG